VGGTGLSDRPLSRCVISTIRHRAAVAASAALAAALRLLLCSAVRLLLVIITPFILSPPPARIYVRVAETRRRGGLPAAAMAAAPSRLLTVAPGRSNHILAGLPQTSFYGHGRTRILPLLGWVTKAKDNNQVFVVLQSIIVTGCRHLVTVTVVMMEIIRRRQCQ